MQRHSGQFILMALVVLHTLVHTFIASRIDYCNAVLYEVTDAVIRRRDGNGSSFVTYDLREWHDPSYSLRMTLMTHDL